MSNLEIAKDKIRFFFDIADCGIFNNRSLVGDILETIYDQNGLQIDICYHYSYFEVFGLSKEEFKELRDFYKSLQEKAREE